jgi:hypothetical protein
MTDSIKSLHREEEFTLFLNTIEPMSQSPAPEELDADQLQGIVAAGRDAFTAAPQSFQAILSPRFNSSVTGSLTIDNDSLAITIYDRLMYVQGKVRLLG